jgi:TolB-like protein/Flp pilus assembly protein TadD
MQVLKELQRRNVFRVTIGYIVSIWLLLQVADLALENIGSPAWVMKTLMLVLALGFPVVVFFSWAYEVTPEGIKRESEIDRSQSITHVTGRKLDRAITAVLIIALGYFAYDKYVLTDEQITIVAAPVVVEASSEKLVDTTAARNSLEESGPSIAVLPFVNMSADESSVYFSDGLADTVLHMLAQVRELRVAARTSSFQFRDQTLDVAKIGKQLNVGTILEGSVQRSGDKIRVTAQLIDVGTGYHLWSGNYDRDLTDVFAIQDEIATEVVAALKVSLLSEPARVLNRDQTDNVDAYTAYLLGINDLNNSTSDSLASAITYLQEATRLDPNYALAHAMLGSAYLKYSDYGFMNATEGRAAARVAANRALDIAPASSAALAVLGLAELFDGQLDSAGKILTKAIEDGPNDTIALISYARYQENINDVAGSSATYQKILQLDPLSALALEGLTLTLIAQRQYAEASETVARSARIYPGSPVPTAFESYIEVIQGNLANAIAPMTHSYELDKKDSEGPVLIGTIYLNMGMPSEAETWFDRAIEINVQGAMSRAARLWLNYYLQQNVEESVRLARELLNEDVENRYGSRDIALIFMIEHAARTGNYGEALDLLDNLFPHLFDDPPHDFLVSMSGAYFTARALIESGDQERGARLMNTWLDLQEPDDEAYGVSYRSVAARLLLGDTDGALKKLAGLSQDRYRTLNTQMILEHGSEFDLIRDEPAFIGILNEYRENAVRQRTIMQAMNNDAIE